MSSSFSTSDSTSTSLLDRAKAQDPKAWQALCDLYAPLVYRWARQAGLQANDATDVGQEVFHVVSTRLTGFRRERPEDSFRGWLWGITKNKVREHFRRRTIGVDGTGGTAAWQRLQEITSALPSDSSQFEASDSRTTLMHRALKIIRDEFEESTWQAFWRSAINEHKTADIAAETGVSTAAIRQAKYRVLRRLRQVLADLD